MNPGITLWTQLSQSRAALWEGNYVLVSTQTVAVLDFFVMLD